MRFSRWALLLLALLSPDWNATPEPLEEFLEEKIIRHHWPGQRLQKPVRIVRTRESDPGERTELVSLTLSPSGMKIDTVLTFASRDSLQEAADLSGPDCAYSPELGCLAELFPHDWKLPDLPGAMRPEWALKGLRGMSTDITARGTQLHATLLRYRPHSRAVVLYEEMNTNGRVIDEAIGKVFRSPGKAERAWHLGRRVYEHTSAAPVVPRYLALKNTLLVMEKAPGTDLDSLLSQPEFPDAIEAVEAAARALRAFHEVPPTDVKNMKPPKELRSVVDLARSLEADAIGCREIDRVVRTLELRHEMLPASPETALVHGSFKPSAVLYGNGRTTLVDLDYAACGDPALDIAHFSGHLRQTAVTTGRTRLGMLADRFVAAYGSEIDAAARRDRVRLIEATMLALSGLKSLSKAGDTALQARGLNLVREAERRLA